jgi:hypothetical protein
MTAHHSRKLLLAAMLVTTLSAPALANDSATTAQQTSVGQGIVEVAPPQDDAVVAKEGYATVTNGPMSVSTTPPRARTRATEPRRAVSAARPAGDYYRPSGAPLILGIRH